METADLHLLRASSEEFFDSTSKFSLRYFSIYVLFFNASINVTVTTKGLYRRKCYGADVGLGLRISLKIKKERLTTIA